MPDSETSALHTIAVHSQTWPDPALAGMVAPPVVVTSVPVVVPGPPAAGTATATTATDGPAARWRRQQMAWARGNMPVGRHRRATR
ncbi:hypothetical protein [Mangrovihabitans endophyticus]|uniref:Uncharacterized protein n=1 Tax=Mangrovihabitans endophyticus TaxID=1751298 RepID=A0A8J3FPP0_9ACTN|nr:hypothetical protein [Mangrovihabitans endophyticus]GGL02840.1 hypothetical protein GCM10012284_41810 [Mangrovihabitans endophyticus]